MKPEFMRIRRALAATVTALLIAAGIVVLSPAFTASAHDKTVTARCDTGLSISLTRYPQGSTVNVVVDGTTRTGGAETFAPGWSANYSWDSTVDHKYSVAVVSPDDPINPSTLQGAKGWTFTTSGIVPGCPPPDSPVISVTGKTCANQSAGNGTITFSLAGVTKQYTVALLSGTTTKASATSTGGVGIFTNLSPGTYKIMASAQGGPSATSAEVTVILCTQEIPNIDLTVQPCAAGGTPGAVTATLSNLVVGNDYTVQLFSSADTLLGTQAVAAASDNAQLRFAAPGPGTYYITVSESGSGNLMTTSSNTTIGSCTAAPTITVTLKPCVPVLPLAGIASQGIALKSTTPESSALKSMALTAPMASTTAEREISVHVDGLLPATVYTVQLVTTDSAVVDPVIASVVTPGDSATTFAHTFTNVPTPGEYTVRLLGGNAPLASDPITAPLCFTVPTLAPPSIEAAVAQCDGVDPAMGALSASLIDLDATKTYYVRIVDNGGAVVAGGSDQLVTGATTAMVHFPGITTPGTYTAQLLIDPGKQLAATDPNTVTLTMCLPTLAMTGPGALVPLGGIAALLLTLGGAVVMGRLRRRMAL